MTWRPSSITLRRIYLAISPEYKRNFSHKSFFKKFTASALVSIDRGHAIHVMLSEQGLSKNVNLSRGYLRM